MLGIVILNYNSFDKSEKCIEAIERTVHIAYHIFLIDNCSTDDSYDLALSQYSNCGYVHVKRTAKNGGYSYGNNVGIQLAKELNCDAVLVCNPDVVVLDEAVDLMYQALYSDDTVGAAVPTVLDYNRNKALQSRRIMNLEQVKLECKLFTSKKASKYYFDFDKMLKDANGNFLFDGKSTGCCIMFKNKLFNAFQKLYDEEMFLYFEEDVVAYRLQEINLCTIFVPAAQIWHNHKPSANNKGKAFARYCSYKSLVYYAKIYCNASLKTLKRLQKKLYLKMKIFAFFESEYNKYLIELNRYFKHLLIS